MAAPRPFERLLNRRSMLLGSTLAGVSTSGLLPLLAKESATGGRGPNRSCLVLWMAGGPAQTDTFDLKTGHEHGGPFQPIATSAPGVHIGEHLPEISKWMHKLAVVRSLSTKEGDHGRATEDLRTGQRPQGAIQFPVLGSLVSHECGVQTGELPNYVSILSRGLFRASVPPAGFLGTEYAPLIVGNDAESKLTVENLALARGVAGTRSNDRAALLKELEQSFLDSHAGVAVDAHRTAYARAMKLMSASAAEAFDLDKESKETQERYGSSMFAQGCLLARRLIERRVPFVEVSLGGWDTHYDNFKEVSERCRVLDKPWAALMQDLSDRGLLESTLVVWMGEFGRTPVINPQGGRDHYPKAWSAVLGGGGIVGGSVAGKTSADGLTVEERPTSTPDFLATILCALGLDPKKQNLSNVGRPIRLVDPAAKPVEEILTADAKAHFTPGE